jgi:trimethylamine--corrinoid protein Co-methyltransferase
MHDFEACQSLEKLVLDHEIVGLTQRLTRGIEIRDQPIALDLIEEAIEDRDFLALPHTAKWFRHEAYFPDKVIDRATLGEWEEDGRQDSGIRAHARVAELLASHRTEPLSEDLQVQLLEIMMKDARDQGVEELPVFGDVLLDPVDA